MSGWSVQVAEAAERDLINATLYTRDVLGSPDAALALVDAFEDRVGELSRSPEARPHVRDARLARLGYRWISVKGYMAFYTVDAESRTVAVERLLYARSNWAVTL